MMVNVTSHKYINIYGVSATKLVHNCLITLSLGFLYTKEDLQKVYERTSGFNQTCTSTNLLNVLTYVILISFFPLLSFSFFKFNNKCASRKIGSSFYRHGTFLQTCKSDLINNFNLTLQI